MYWGKIKQRFSNEDESDFWWETGIVMSVNSENMEFTVNYFDTQQENVDDEIDCLDVHEVCCFPFINEYLNHEIQFL